VTYVYVWRFLVRSGSEADFVAAYGPDGEWARLFRQADGFLGSELLRDRADPRRFLTVDRWVSRQAGRRSALHEPRNGKRSTVAARR
jgi:heme-degrading monooxygenase HmoA